jgi:Mce-associated membrane protein
MNELDTVEEPTEVVDEDHDASLTLPRTTPTRLMAAALLVVTIGLTATGVVFWRQAEANKVEERERHAAISVAEDQALTLTNVNRSNLDEQMEKLIANGTGEFLRQFNATASTFKNVVVKSKVHSTSTVAESGVVEFSPSNAVVLVALDSAVQNQETGQDEPRPYRLKVNLVNEDGKWLVEQMEFVQ